MSSSIRLLQPVKHRGEWLDVWRATGCEPHAHPGYCLAVAGVDEEPIALVVDYENGCGLVPLIVRPIPGTDALDLASPYGYGGPYFEGEHRVQDVLRAVRDYARDSGAASAFLRLTPGAPPGDCEPDEGIFVAQTSKNVVVDIRRPADVQWRHVAHKVRKNVNKARRAGCEVIVDHGLRRVDEFLDVYLATMKRRDAASWFHFDAVFFRELCGELGSHAIAFLAVDAHDAVVSVELVLSSDRRMYSFLGGTLAAAFAMAPNDLLKYEIIKYGAATGHAEYVLGGGREADDGIFRYKATFDPDGIVPFHTARLIGDIGAYERASGRRGSAIAAGLTAPWFPPYREERNPSLKDQAGHPIRHAGPAG